MYADRELQNPLFKKVNKAIPVAAGTVVERDTSLTDAHHPRSTFDIEMRGLLCSEPSTGGRKKGSCEYNNTYTFSVSSGRDCIVEGLSNNIPTSIVLDMSAASYVST